jgi:hypothetical protein
MSLGAGMAVGGAGGYLLAREKMTRIKIYEPKKCIRTYKTIDIRIKAEEYLKSIGGKEG